MSKYYFRLPAYEELNTTQRAAVADNNPIALSGGPGTGKSIVSLWRHILNYSLESPIKSQLITHTKSLAYYLRNTCAEVSEEAANFIDSSKHWAYYDGFTKRDEIIHDEAQDLPLQYNLNLRNNSAKISYGADNQQLITPGSIKPDGTFNLAVCSPESSLRDNFNNSLYQLNNNYRNPKRIMLLAKKLFNIADIPSEIIDSCKTIGEFPRLLITNNDRTKLENTVFNIVNQYKNDEAINIAILVPFGNPNRNATETATALYYFDLLQRKGIGCSYYTNRLVSKLQINNIHITTFKSAKGLEFDVVIIPDFHLYNRTFDVVNWRDYYVGVTRTRSNLYLISNWDIPHLHDSGTNKTIDKVIL